VGSGEVIYRTRTPGVAALLHCDDRFTYTGYDGEYFTFSGAESLTPIQREFAEVYKFFSVTAAEGPQKGSSR
jgi:hypothetical protein